jgi:hypothetical protein
MRPEGGNEYVCVNDNCMQTNSGPGQWIWHLVTLNQLISSRQVTEGGLSQARMTRWRRISRRMEPRSALGNTTPQQERVTAADGPQNRYAVARTREGPLRDAVTDSWELTVPAAPVPCRETGMYEITGPTRLSEYIGLVRGCVVGRIEGGHVLHEAEPDQGEASAIGGLMV